MAGHYCWSATSRATRRTPHRRCSRSTQALDRAIGDLRDAAGPETTLIVVSGDRCGPNIAGWHLLPECWSGSAAAGGKDQGDGTLSCAAPKHSIRSRRCATCCPRIFARALRDACRRRCATSSPSASTPPTSTGRAPAPTACRPTSKATSASTCADASRRASWHPGEEYGQTAQSAHVLAAGTAARRNRRKDRSSSHRGDDAFPGDRRAQLPDLIVQWDAAGPIERDHSERIGVVTGDVAGHAQRHALRARIRRWQPAPAFRAGATLQAATSWILRRRCSRAWVSRRRRRCAAGSGGN